MRARVMLSGATGRTRRCQSRLMAVTVAVAVCAGALAAARPALASAAATSYRAAADAGSRTFTAAGTAHSGLATAHPLTVTGVAGSQAVAVTLPPAGTFTVTVTPGPVILQPAGGRRVASGMLQDVTVAETRNYVPGWSVSGQAGGLRTADELGWMPVATSPLARGAVLGPASAPGTPGGLRTGSALAYASTRSGIGTSTLSAGLVLDLPGRTLASLHSGSLTITYLEAGPQAGGIPGTGL